jgi:hypothetical protein
MAKRSTETFIVCTEELILLPQHHIKCGGLLIVLAFKFFNMLISTSLSDLRVSSSSTSMIVFKSPFFEGIFQSALEISDHQLKVIFKGKHAIEANPVFSKFNNSIPLSLPCQ